MKFLKLCALLFFINFIYQIHCAELAGREEGIALAEQQRLGGRNLGNKGMWTVQQTVEVFKGENYQSWLWEIDLIYGLTNNLGIELYIPLYLANKYLNLKSKGLSDIIVDMQWTFFQKGPNVGLIAGGLKFPSGDLRKLPETGTGTYDFTLEFSALHAGEAWYSSFVLETFLTTKRAGGLKPGNNYDYEFIIGRKVPFFTGNLTISLELFGSYLEPALFKKNIVPDTGGNIIYVGPLFSFTYDSILIDFSFQWAVNQRLLGTQPKAHYTALMGAAISF